MNNEFNPLREFGQFRLDVNKKILWHDGAIVQMPKKAAELLSVLVETGGEVISKDEILEKVWGETFVEESNLTHNVWLLRKTFAECGGEKYIETVPRRGYRFAGEIRKVENGNGEIIIEHHSVSQTLIEEIFSNENEELRGDNKKLAGENEKIVSEQPAIRVSPFSILKSKSFAVAAILLIALAGGFAVWSYQNSSAKTSISEIKSIAVLPLKSFAADAENEPLRWRITDALITRLGEFEKIAVRPTSSVLRFAGENQNLIEAGKKLEVDAVLDGRVQTENDRLRVTLQLISVENGEQLWSEQFDGRADEILALQDAISSRLRQKFAFADADKFNRRPTESNKAYEAYLKGRFLWNQRTAESYWKALEYFNQSIEADSNFALAYTGIADCYHLLQQRNIMSSDEAFLKSEAAAIKALELDPPLAEAHTSLAAVRFIYYSDWKDAEARYRRAIELNPNYAEAHARYGMLLNAWGRFDEAFAELKKAEELDPTSLNIAIYLGANFYFSKQFERATIQFQRILEFAPNTERAFFFLTRIYELNGRYDEAVQAALKERAIASPQTVEPLRAAYQTAGIRGFWQKQIEILKEESKTLHGLNLHIASRYALLGDTESALEYVEKDLENRGSMWNYGRVDPSFDSLRSNSKFQELMNKTAARK